MCQFNYYYVFEVLVISILIMRIDIYIINVRVRLTLWVLFFTAFDGDQDGYIST